MLTILAGVAVLAMVAGLGSVVADVVIHGTKLTSDHTVSIDGTTPADPQVLASSAGYSLPIYALGRMVESEAGGLPELGKLGVAFAALTHAASAGKSIDDLLLHSTGAGNGYFGRQDQGRYAATSKDPSPAALDAADKASTGEVDDPTGGADQWDSPWSYKDDPVTGETAAEKAAAVAAARRAAGKEVVTLEGIPEYKLRFWRAA
ncbi:MAG TPA: hypothetical protein VES65_11445 [Solirubrobacteraceae bacterium]|nr:hypothetical protein [Solirubrobacteraceae bacterium]